MDEDLFHERRQKWGAGDSVEPLSAALSRGTSHLRNLDQLTLLTAEPLIRTTADPNPPVPPLAFPTNASTNYTSLNSSGAKANAALHPPHLSTIPDLALHDRPSCRKDFQIAIICALPLEYDAVYLLFDEIWNLDYDEYGRTKGDTNHYTTGRIGKHNVVLTLLPNMGKVAAAGAAASFRSTYSSLKLALLVGVCGGVPSIGTDEVLLGDVVISNDLLQYDFGRQYNDKFVPKNTVQDSLGRPNKDVRSFIATLGTEQGKRHLRKKAVEHMKGIQGAAVRGKCQNNYNHPDLTEDKLFASSYQHKHRGERSCDFCKLETDKYCDKAAHASCTELGCDEGQLVSRKRWERKKNLGPGDAGYLEIFIGRIASGDTVMKSSERRDYIINEYDVIAFDMEGAGIWDEVPCIIVKGICDYSDSHKNKAWQPFAAATAAAVAKTMLERYTLTDRPESTSQSLESEERNRKCLEDLRTTDPRHDKNRIEQTKGGLLKDSYRWILESSEFKQWRYDEESRLLWIKGDPGKGKTMLLCGIVNDMSPLTMLRDKKATTLLSYFFCQATDSRINSATSVLRGLIYLLIDQQPSLVSHVRKNYDQGATNPFKGVNAWVALSVVFENILQDLHFKNTYLIVDALDECETDLPQLLNLIVQSASKFSRIKWIISSRNNPDIEARLRFNDTQMRLSLELNQESVSYAVKKFVDFRVSQLLPVIDDRALQEKVRGQIYAKAGGTFLWAALVIKELELVESWDILDVLQEIPRDLEPLYHRMLKQVQELRRRDPEFCRLVLSTISLAYRPLDLLELGALSGLPREISTNLDNVTKVVNKCGSFLTIRKNRAYFIHQSAKDFLLEKAFAQVFPSGKAEVNYTIFSRSHEIMSRTLRRDIYGLHTPGFLIDEVTQPDPDPLNLASYSCVYWVDHLCDTRKSDSEIDLGDNGIVHVFLKKHFLHWIEALSLLKSTFGGILAVHKLESLLRPLKSPHLYAFICDAKRFTRYYQSLIEKTPLQLYCSALVFAPEESIVRRQFEKSIPRWILRKPKMQAHWNAALQTLKGHSDSVWAVAFSPDGKQVVSGSGDKTVRLWDAATGAPLQTLEGHSDEVSSVAFSPDGKQVMSGSDDKTVRLWDAATGAPVQTLESHSSWVTSVAFSPDGKQVVSGSGDEMVLLWDAATGARLQKLKGHSGSVMSAAFSPDGKQVVSGSNDKTVRLWDVAMGAPLLTFGGHSRDVTSVAFSPDGKQVVSGSNDKTVRLWDAATGAPLLTLKGHSSWVMSVAFSPDGKQVVSGSDDEMVRFWDAATGAPLQTLESHPDWVTSVAFSPDGQLLKSLRVAGDWVVEGTSNILWLPPDYLPTRHAIGNGIVTLGHVSKGVSFFEFVQGVDLIIQS